MKNNGKNYLIDVMDGRLYNYEKNQLNLILFADAASYNKSGNKSMWAIFSEIVELPPILRHASENTIFHSSWSHSNPDFNKYLENYNEQIELLLKNGLIIGERFFKFKIHLLLCDGIARSKVCYYNQHNGRYGCIKCMHPTIHISKTIYPTLERLNDYYTDENVKKQNDQKDKKKRTIERDSFKNK